MSELAYGVAAFFVVGVLGFAGLELRILTERRRVRIRIDQKAHRADTRVVDKRRKSLPFRTATFATAAIGVTVGLLLDGFGLAIILGGVVVLGSLWIRDHRHRARLRLYDQHLLRVLDLVVLSVKSGAGLVAAMREAAESRHGVVEADLREVIRRMDLGVPFEVAMTAWPERCPLRSVRLTVAAITLAWETGGSLAVGLTAVRQTVRNAIVAESVARTHAAQSRSSAIVLACLPFALSGPMLTLNESARTFMLHSPLGILLMTTGVALDLLGVWWMTRLIDRVQS